MSEEIQLRAMCLDFAVKAMNGAGEWDDQGIVKLAQEFYDFVKGEAK